MSVRTVVLALVLAACAGSRTRPTAPTPAAEAPIPDSELGLSKTSAFDVPNPPLVKPNDSVPGELPLVPRPYALVPPRVPHGIADFLPITRGQNACVDCHAVKEKEPGQPTPIPASHDTDLRNAPGRAGGQVVGARWVCTTCHVPLTDARPLVGNAFRP